MDKMMNKIFMIISALALCVSAPTMACFDNDDTICADNVKSKQSRKRARTQAHEQEHLKAEQVLTSDQKKSKSEDVTVGDVAPSKSILKKSSYGPNIASGNKRVSWGPTMRVRLFTNPLTYMATGGWCYDHKLACPSLYHGMPQEGTETIRDKVLVFPKPKPEHLEAPRHTDLSMKYPLTSIDQLLRHEKLLALFETQAQRSELKWTSQHQWLEDNAASNDDYWIALSQGYEENASDCMTVVDGEDFSNEEDSTDYDSLRFQAGEYYTKAAASVLASFGSVLLDEDGHPDCLDAKTLTDCPQEMARYVSLLTSAMKCHLDSVDEYNYHIHKVCRGYLQSLFGLLQIMKDNPNWEKDLAVCKKSLERMENNMQPAIEEVLQFKEHDIDECEKCQDIFQQLEVANGLYVKIWEELHPKK